VLWGDTVIKCSICGMVITVDNFWSHEHNEYVTGCNVRVD